MFSRPTPFARSALGVAGALFWILGASAAAYCQEEPSPEAEAEAVSRKTPVRRPQLKPKPLGYIDDASVRTQVRIRYDSARDADRPDRAEFLYGKCSCFNKAAGQDAASPGPAQDLDLQEVELRLEKAFGPGISLFAELPLRTVDLTLTDFFAGLQDVRTPVQKRGLGDVRLGVKYGLIARHDRLLTLQLRGYFPTGDAREALGTDHSSVEPGLLHVERLSDRWTVSSELRWWHPLSGSSDPVTGRTDPRSIVGRVEGGALGAGRDPRDLDAEVRNDRFAGDVLRVGVGAAYESRGTRITVSPIVELVGWLVLDGYSTPPAPGVPLPDHPDVNGYVEEAGGDAIANLKLGVRVSDGRQGSVYLGYGVALTDDVWYEDILRVEYRYSF